MLNGKWRKLSLLPLCTLLVGWLVYLVGFALLMVHGDTSSHPRLDYLPHYLAVATPPLLVILACLHAALFGLASSILGLFAALLSVVCFSSIGYVFYMCAAAMYWSDLRDDEGRDVNCILMFSGTLLSALSWFVVTVMWNYFTYKLPWGTVHSFDDVVDEDGNMTPSPPPLPKNPPPFAGVARKIAMVILALESASWCVLIAGIDSQARKNSSAMYHAASEEELGFSFGTWAVCVVGVLLVISAVLHSASNGNTSSLIGVFTSLLSLVYIMCLGHLVFAVSIDLYHGCQDDKQCSVSAIPDYRLYQLCGGVGSSVFWGFVLALWPFYFRPLENIHGLQRSVQNQREYYFRSRHNENMPLLYQSNGEQPHRSTAPTAPFL